MPIMTPYLGIRLFYSLKPRTTVKYLNGKALLSSYAIRPPKHPQALQMSVPPLNQSIDKYLAYIHPIVSSEQYEDTRKVASAYLNSVKVLELQDLLIDRSRTKDNWLFEWWLRSYLENRAPVVINSNFAFRLQTLECKSDERWLNNAAIIVQGVLVYKTILQSDKLPTEYFQDGDPMCMHQHYAVLSNCRIPGAPHDRIFARKGSPHTNQMFSHICVFYRNRPYTMNFTDAVSKKLLQPDGLYSQLAYIVATGRKLPPGPPIGLLTSLPRDEWNRVHLSLRQNRFNSKILASIEESLFILCLDEDANLPPVEVQSNGPDTPLLVDRRETTSAINTMHGQLFNSGNRWFDKSLQFILSRDGAWGTNCEHTAADASSVIPIVDSVYDILNGAEEIQPDRLPAYNRPQELKWQLPKLLEQELEKASDALRTLIDSVEVEYGHFQSFGSDAIKKLKSSPDAFVQVAIQLAYARLHPDRLPPPTYETGSLRRFHLGRTDTIRSCSPESVLFTQSMLNDGASVEERANLLRNALRSHQDFTKQLMRGQAFDRHLLGLRLLANSMYDANSAEGKEVCLLFNDSSYAESNRYRLSTSQVSSNYDIATLFGPAVCNGYGVCYNIHLNSIQMTSSSFRNSGGSQSPVVFLTACSQALCDMKELLNGSPT